MRKEGKKEGRKEGRESLSLWSQIREYVCINREALVVVVVFGYCSIWGLHHFLCVLGMSLLEFCGGGEGEGEGERKGKDGLLFPCVASTT
jgi:hypothetical protein